MSVTKLVDDVVGHAPSEPERGNEAETQDRDRPAGEIERVYEGLGVMGCVRAFGPARDRFRWSAGATDYQTLRVDTWRFSAEVSRTIVRRCGNDGVSQHAMT